MKKLFLIIALLLSSSSFAAVTTVYRNDSDIVTMPQILTTSTGATSAFPLGPYMSGSVQCAWASVTNTSATFLLQVSNDNSNWDNISGATTTTSGSSGTSTWMLEPFISAYAKVFVSSTSTTGNLNCIGVLQK